MRGPTEIAQSLPGEQFTGEYCVVIRGRQPGNEHTLAEMCCIHFFLCQAQKEGDNFGAKTFCEAKGPKIQLL